MKYFVFCLLLCACSPKYKAGDCTKTKYQTESWEAKVVSDEERIIEVGKNKYHYYFYDHILKRKYDTSFPIEAYDSISEKIPCPEFLK